MPATARARLPLAAGALLGLLLAAGGSHAQQANLTVSATVVGQCILSGATLDFGTYVAAQGNARDGQASIGVDCPRGLDVTIEMSQGHNPGPGDFRNMASGDDFLQYQLYRDHARSRVWGARSDGREVDPTRRGNRIYEVFGRIPAGQTVAVGDYTDTVLITLTING